MSIASERREYGGLRLLETATPDEPFALFGEWLRGALDAQLLDATAMALATVGIDGKPHVRIVLLKDHDPAGLIFYTRYSTQKGRDLAHNPHAAAAFHWREQDRQVRIEGRTERVATGVSRAYFATRPRGSQLAARAASGLDRVPAADVLARRFAEESARWGNSEIPMPDDWGGYRLVPERFEFWQGQPSRLHDRLSYEVGPDGTWSKERLAP